MGHSSYQVSVCAFNRGKLKVSIFLSGRLLQMYGKLVRDNLNKWLKDFVTLMKTRCERSELATRYMGWGGSCKRRVIWSQHGVRKSTCYS